MKTKLLFVMLALQCAWILGRTVVQERALAQGQVVLLETRPVDPRDLLRGDYVILRYKISDVPLNLFSPPPKPQGNIVFNHGVLVHVALEPHGAFYEVSRASAEPFDPAPGQVLLKGHVAQMLWNAQSTSTVHVEYGLERYYVSEGTGNPRGKLTVQAVIPNSGQARIKEVFIDGKPYTEVMKKNPTN